MNRLLCGLGVAILLVLAWTGLYAGVTQIAETRTLGQEIQTIAQLDYGILSVLAIVARFWIHRYQWRLAIWLVWVVSLAAAGGLAPVVWGEAGIGTGLLAGCATLLIALGVLWLLSRESLPGH